MEHSMSIAAGVYRGSMCQNKTAIQGYFYQAYPQIYNLVDFSGGGFFEFLVEFLNCYCTFLWTFMDIFIVATSICLSTRLCQLNAFLIQYKGIVRKCNKIKYKRVCILCFVLHLWRPCLPHFGPNNAIHSL